MQCDRVVLDGTVRARTPEETWAVLAPLLRHYGITRVARLTGLDSIGLPVWAAVRPDARTLTVTQGKGATDLLAKISAVMEAIELWHAEQPLTAVLTGTAADVQAPYPISALPAKVHHEAVERLPLEWTLGSGIRTGRDVPVPVDVIRRSTGRPRWAPDVIRATSTGLACGNTWEEALLHAMFEVVERDALFADDQRHGRLRTLIDPGSINEPYARGVVERLAAAHVDLEIALVRNSYRLPVCVAYLWSEDYPVVFAGGGCHTDPDIALARAMTEAAQSRLSCISGVRDDLPSDEDVFTAQPAPPPAPQAGRDWSELTTSFAPWRGDFAKHTRAVATRIEDVTGWEPVYLDLARPQEPLAAVQVVCPGTRSRIRRSISR